MQTNRQSNKIPLLAQALANPNASESFQTRTKTIFCIFLYFFLTIKLKTSNYKHVKKSIN
jgi:hypothetical protein